MNEPSISLTVRTLLIIFGENGIIFNRKHAISRTDGKIPRTTATPYDERDLDKLAVLDVNFQKS